jgi:Zn-dependent protease
MALITLTEILYFIILIAVIGFIFTGFFSHRPRTVYDLMRKKRRFDIRDFYFAILVTAPAIVLHELAHKFVAMSYGFGASFQLFPLGLAIGLVLKLIGSPLILIAPGYVTIGQEAFANATAYRIIAFAGPAMNFLLWLGATIALKISKLNLNRTQTAALKLTRTINMILFIFNMIPFGPLDGAKVLNGPPT